MPSTISADRDRFLSFAFAAADLLVELNHEGRVTYAAGGIKSITGSDPGENGQWLLHEIVADEDRLLLAKSLKQLRLKRRFGPIQIKFENSSQPVLMRGIQALDDDLQRLTFGTMPPGSAPLGDLETDHSTGLLTPESFEKMASTHIAEAKDGTGPELTMIHLAGLAQLTDKGQGGGELIKHVSAVLRSLSVDGRSAGQLSDGRLGFVHHKGGADNLIEELDEVAQEQGIENFEIETNSIELGQPNLSEHEACAALSHVMRAFAGKVDGQASFASLDDALRQSYEDTAKRISNFRSMVAQLSFQIHFQPIVRLMDRTIAHFEALSRFKNVDSPFEMINFAEDVGITQDFDLAVVRKVVEQMGMRAGQKSVPKIAINLSTRSLEQDIFVENLLQLLNVSGKVAQKLTFEVTESAEIRNLERMSKIIERIRRAGHAVALDDFGAGAAAFHYIRALKVDYVKIDGAYIQKILQSERDASIVRAMVELCRSLSVGTIAEMVETQEQVDALVEMQVHCAQGYFFAKPSEDLDIPSPVTPALAQ